MKSQKNTLTGSTLLLCLFLLVTSCTEELSELSEVSGSSDQIVDPTSASSSPSSITPWDFDSDFVNVDNFQADNDGNGAHNWNESGYIGNPDRLDRGFDIRDFVYVSTDDLLILQCPNGSSRRRTEFRDVSDINLDVAHSMELTFSIGDYDEQNEMIITQLHNDGPGVNRPYVTVAVEHGEIEFKRTNNIAGSGVATASESMEYKPNDRYTVKVSTENGSRDIVMSVENLDTNEKVETTFDFEPNWDSSNGNFYWKFGVYMPQGGSTNTCMRLEDITIAGGE